MTTTRKRRTPKPVTPVDVPDTPDVVVPPATPSKADWVHRILYVAVIALAWHYFTAKQGDPHPVTPEPDAPVASSLYQEVAPLFPPEQNETASLYAAYFAAQADKVELDKKPIPQPVFVAARKAMGLADNPELLTVVKKSMEPFKDLPMVGVWPPEKLQELVSVYRELSDACLQASAD